MPMFYYPTDTLQVLKQRWGLAWNIELSHHKPPPPDEALVALLETCYHASFLAEEGRRLVFRVAYLPRTELQERPRIHPELTTLDFEKPRQFSVSELLRLSPAVDVERAIVCVEPAVSQGDSYRLQIWGLLDLGASWSTFVSGRSRGAMVPPDCLVVSGFLPGNLTISRQGWILLSLRGGQIQTPRPNPLDQGPVADFFKGAAESFQKEVLTTIDRERWGRHDHDEDYPQQYFINLFQRLLRYIRQRRHGGTVLVVPDALTLGDTRLSDRVLIKYPARYNRIWNLGIAALKAHYQYYDGYFSRSEGRESLAARTLNEERRLRNEIDDVERCVEDTLEFLASLTAVDGALLITDRFGLLGFGTEVVVVSPSLAHVRVSTNKDGTEGETGLIEDYGTRHRSAFRFCSSYESAMAFVLSQDGGVRAVRRVGPDLIVWPGWDSQFFGL